MTFGLVVLRSVHGRPTFKIENAAIAAFVVLSSQSADAAFLRSEHEDADQMTERTQQALRAVEEKARHLAKLVEALIYQAEHPND